MERLKVSTRLIGWAFFILGVMFMPIGYGVSPKRDLSAFSNVADTGAFLTWGLVLRGMGLVILVVAFLLPGEN